MVGLGVIGDQHAVGAAADGLVGIHVAIHAEVVGEDEALKAPLVTQDVVEQLVTGAGPNGADVVEGGHDRLAAAVLHGDLEGLQVDLTDGLLVGPGAQHAAAVGLLIVEGEVLHVGVYAVLLSAQDGVGSHVAAQHAVLGVVLEVTAGESGTVGVHSGSVPAGHAHLVGHLADVLTEGVGQIHVPGGGDHHSGGEADGALAGEVVVDGGRAVAVDGLNLADAVDGGGLVAADGDEGVHLSHGQLIQQGIPLGIVIVHAAQVLQLQAVLGAGGGHHVVGIIELVGVVVAVVVEGGLGLLIHGEVGGSGGSLVVVGKAVGAAEVGHVALSEGELVGSGHSVGGAGAVVAVGDGGGNIVGLGSDDVVGVGVDGDGVVAGLQHVSAGTVGVIGSHILHVEGNGQSLGSAGLQHVGLVEGDEVGAGLLNAAVGVGGIVVDLDHVLAGHIAGVGDGDVEGDGAVALRDGAHLLGEGGVAQAVAEGILHGGVVIDEALGSGGLIELVTNIDALHVVDEGGNRAVHGELVHVVIEHAAEVVPVGGLGQVVDIGVHHLGGGVHLAGEDLAQGVEAGLTGAGHDQSALDGVILVQPAQLHGVGGVDDHDDVVKLAGDALHHSDLAVAQLQVVLAGIAVVVLGADPHTGSAPGAALFKGVLAVVAGGQVGALAAGAGDDDQSGVGELLGVFEDAGGIILVHGGLGDGPVLAPHAHGGTGVTELGVEVGDGGVVLDAGVAQALQQGDSGIGVGQAAGTGAAVNGVGGRPAEDIQLGVVQGQSALVLHHNDAFLGNGLAQLIGGSGSLVSDGAVAHGQGDHAAHGTKADEVHGDGDGQHHGQGGLAPDQELLGPGHFAAGDHGGDGQDQHNSKPDQVRFAGVQHGDDVFNVDGKHFILPPVVFGRAHTNVPPESARSLPQFNPHFPKRAQTAVFST